MKKYCLFPLLLVMIALTGISCRTAPDTQALTEALNESMAKAEAARQRAIDFESPAYFPSEWEALEAQLEAANSMPVADAEEILQATEAFDALASAYDDIFNRTLPLYAQAREDEIKAVRDTLIATGLTRDYPEYLRAADRIAIDAFELYEAGEYYEARETAAIALTRYENLLLAARAYLVRQEIINRGFAGYDRENFDKADDIACKALEKFEADDIEGAVPYIEEALLRFNLVLSNGWIAFASERRELAAAERNQALAERVNIASRELFRDAEVEFEQAERAFSAEAFNEAASFYIDAEALFAIAREDTRERRERAETAIRAAEERIEESGETAIEAERVIEGGSR